jgi:integrase
MAKPVFEVEKPRYVRVHYSPSGDVFFRFETNKRIKEAGFRPYKQPLGTNQEEAFRIANETLLPALDAFMKDKEVIVVEAGPRAGANDELFDRWKQDPTFTVLKPRTIVGYTKHLDIAANHVFRSGPAKCRRFGELAIKEVDVLLARLLVDEVAQVTNEDPATGAVIVRKRETTAQHVRATLSTCYSAMLSVHPDVPFANPFTKGRRRKHKKKKTYYASIENLAAFDYFAREAGFPNMGTLALAAFELEMRVESIATKLDCAHYKPADRPDQILITHWKTGEERWVFLNDVDGAPLYAALEARLDHLKGDRTSGILIPKDKTPDCAWARPDKPLGRFYKIFRIIADRANLPKACSFTSFRHGGITEGAEAGLTEHELMALSGHKDPKTIQAYITQTRTLFENAQRKRLMHRSRVIDGLRRRGALDQIADGVVFEVLAKLPTVPKPNDEDDETE